jgi:hypothetical protein
MILDYIIATTRLDTLHVSFQILSRSLFTYHTFIRRYIILVTEKASLNKLQK